MKTVLFVVMLGLVIPVNAEWKSSSSEDEFDDTKSFYATSSRTSSTKSMSSPYSDVNSWIGVGCNKEDGAWAYVGFNESNFTDTETKDGYNVLELRVRFDDYKTEYRFTQNWKGHSIQVTDDIGFINDIKQHNTMLLETRWFREGKVYFKHDLGGATKTIDKIMANCSGNALTKLVEEYNNAALINAVELDNTEMVKMLLAAGANPNTVSKDGETVLISATYKFNSEIIKMLLAAGVNPNMINKYGNTALIWAVKWDNYEIAKMLIDAGANPHIKSKDRRTALNIATQLDLTDIIEILKAAGAE